MRIDIQEMPSPDDRAFEIIERKGQGHPDTLSDHLAERLSRTYAQYTRDRFGTILHHNFDKLGLLGGRARVSFGSGVMIAPIRVLLNGRASQTVGDEHLPVRPLLIDAACSFMAERLPKLDTGRDLIFHDNLSSASSPGHVTGEVRRRGDRASWFEPSDPDDVRELSTVCSNDTSVGCCHWPLSPTERLVLEVERRLTDESFRSLRPWLGTDIKIMACRVGGRLDLTLCVPQIADHVPGLHAYRTNLEEIRSFVGDVVGGTHEYDQVNLHLNTKDDFRIPELYLTAIGSSIESGDEGLVGRGNRPNGLIAMRRPYSMEGACGKNPVYHVGKMYNIIAAMAAKRLFERFKANFEVWLVSQEGRPLGDPWLTVVRSDAVGLDRDGVEAIFGEVLLELPLVTGALLEGSIVLA